MQEQISLKVLPEIVDLEKKKALIDYEKAGVIAQHAMNETIEKGKELDQDAFKDLKELAAIEYENSREKAN